MKLAWGGTMLALGAGVATFAIVTPYRYGTWLDPSATLEVGGLALNYGAGLQTALMHIAKVLFVAAIFPAWRRSGWAGAICVAVCVPLVVLSVWNAVALLALQRSARVMEARAAAEHAGIVRGELESIGARLALVGWKPLATVEAEIAAERHHWMWDATSDCTKVANGGQRQFCARLARLEGARGAAREAERLRDRETELRRDMSRLPVATESRQPDLIMLAEWLGISLSTAEILRTLLWAAVVEVVEIAALGFAGFFWATRNERIHEAGARSLGVASQTNCTARSARSDREPASTTSTVIGISPLSRGTQLEADGCGVARTRKCEDTGRRVRQGSRPHTGRHSPSRDEGEQRRAVDLFVASLSCGPKLRTTGSALFDAYKRMRE